MLTKNQKARQDHEHAKAMLEENPDDFVSEIEAAELVTEYPISAINFISVREQVKNLVDDGSVDASWNEGVPYVDFRAFNGWKSLGRTVKRGAKALIFVIAFTGRGQTPDDGSEPRRFPINVGIFHFSQTTERTRR